MLNITRAGRGYILRAEQELELPLDQVFKFFSQHQNLERITPGFLNFKVLSTSAEVMQEGLLIDYRLSLHGVPLRWQSEITCWEPPYRFVDEQRRGPYRYWIHEHSFKSKKDELGKESTLVKDEVRYSVFGGELIHRFFVKPDIEKIFSFRLEALNLILSGQQIEAKGKAA